MEVGTIVSEVQPGVVGIRQDAPKVRKDHNIGVGQYWSSSPTTGSCWSIVMSDTQQPFFQGPLPSTFEKCWVDQLGESLATSYLKK